ncbi:hypothetical protein GCM10010912_15950 [Paenibacillus albidus]|uniref:Uncharacterized protein n=1 Tax=Paenibacillus albidus TaxID=2041023 RepID=A0A917C5F6_9BACL|nr:hypothetical protein [Paenibacillus albidus]GGF71625.1 hypothetical protein GCM10010912_15950 [Paenibacillus albidus]
MNLFQLKAGPRGSERVAEFLNNNMVSIGHPGLGDLENAGRAEIEEKMIRLYGYRGVELQEHVEAAVIFAHTIQDGDYVLVADGDWVHLGDLGDYFYVEPAEAADGDNAHRRGVTWLTHIPRVALQPGVQQLLAEKGAVTQFQEPIAAARLDLWITDVAAISEPVEHRVRVDEATIAAALDILKQALGSEDAERRERAAVAILQYAK